MSPTSERPAKRVRQACEPCRRKKSRCPGEKPICSYCARLQQVCVYAEERSENGRNLRSVSPAAQSPSIRTSRPPTSDARLEDRLKSVESQLAEVLANQVSLTRSPAPQGPEPPTRLHRRNPIQTIAEAYLTYCDCQPLPLFHRSTFLQTLKERGPEVLFSVLALASRFTPLFTNEPVTEYVEAARAIISKKVFDGAVALSTIQSLCLLSLVDFTGRLPCSDLVYKLMLIDGNTRRASIHSSLAMSLAQNAGLTRETHASISKQEKEERRRAFWSLFLLKRLHGADFMVLDFSAEDNFPWYPETTGKVSKYGHQAEQFPSNGSDSSVDKGIVAYAIQLSEVWFKITRYAWRRGILNESPPWSPQSEYSVALAQQMDFETRMPYIHRFNPAKFSQRPIEELDQARDYWGPWLLIQFLYHTNLCLLNHPLLLSLRLRNFKGVIPEIFLQNTADLMASHASWIINFIDMLEAKEFKVSDPFLGHCVAIVATIYLQESFVDDEGKRRDKQCNFDKCLQFIRGFGAQWPHVGRIAQKLASLSETVSSTQVASDEPIRQNRKLLIDLGQFFEILEYSSSSEIAGTARNLFDASLHSTLMVSRTEMAQTTVLPEPTRVERQEFGTPTLGTPVAGVGMAVNVLQGNEFLGFGGAGGSAGAGAGHGSIAFGTNMDSHGAQQPFQFSDDELAVLAENFFHQRPQVEGQGSAGGWWNLGNL
ncbi:hypothetical protein HYALB_00005069 [Hymenoscyphus albidus]|uniref:Zn(2)-C6 fungal-type domain-containing protein n=1 Tax=Hymenoscyphus albidus TaxID=595503 RepID=A0A9N9Q7Z1_9HELO|nr:hypothetical protein HYALB_00005069 [Hymenoscyphus albidus]